MNWSFELSLTVFFVVACLSEVATRASRQRITLPLALGVLCIAGYTSGLLDPAFVQTSTLVQVGAISFNVFVINAGTLVDFGEIRRQRHAALFCVAALTALTLVTGVTMGIPFGTEIARITPGAMVGNGAANAIAQVQIGLRNPALAVFPWMLFMLQGVFSVPLFLLLSRRACAESLAAGGQPPPPAQEVTGRRVTLCSRVPDGYKTTAYTLGLLMLLSLLNRAVHGAVFAPLGLPLNITALLFGLLAGQLGLIDRNPLRTADCFGLLMLGLMALMADMLARNSLEHILSLLPAALVMLAVGTVTLLAAGLLASRPSRLGKWQGMLLGIACMTPFPASLLLLEQAIGKSACSEADRGMLTGRLLPRVKIVSQLSTGVLSILIASLMIIFL